MAYSNKIISNLKTRQEIKFLKTTRDTGGRLLEMESTYHPKSVQPAPHYHPFQDEVFSVISGELTVLIDGRRWTLLPGDSIHLPAKKRHAMWNSSEKKTVVNWKVSPALDTEYFLETAMGISASDKSGEAGKPGILQVVLLARKYADVFRLSKPPFAVQRVFFYLLAPIARLLGYRATYPEFID
jgi:quercetin dioxygenase-like cupin family protein